jgi:hypothetical protein
MAPMAIRCIFAISLSVLAAACANSSQTVTGTARAPIAATEVRVYTHAPANFEEIAVLSASRRSISSADGERVIQKMITRMKGQAALLGANGLLLEDFSDEQGLSLGTRVGSDSYTHNGSISVGAGGSLGVIKKTAKGRAIFVPPDT